ncbi:MAG: ABC transporter ATP-binding protein [Eubacteriales bacterium]|nr:ABC transporter ATP-binding protein [Eubacteriales bacterium]
MKKKRNKSIIGVLQFAFGIMSRKEKAYFAFLGLLYAFSGALLLVPAQIIAILVSLIGGQSAQFFGIPIPSDINLTTLILGCATLVFVISAFETSLHYFKNKFVLKLYMKVKEVGFSWATTPRKNLNLGMTTGDATYRINESIADFDWVMNCLYDTILPNLFSSIASAIYICLIEIYAIPVLLVGLIITTIVFLVRQKIENPVTKQMEKCNSRVTNFLVNTLSNLTLVNLFRSQKLESHNLDTKIEDYKDVSKKRFRIWQFYWIAMALIDVVATYSIILICSSRVASGVVSASSIVLIISYVEKVFSPIQNFGWFINSSTQLMTKIERLEELRPTEKTEMNDNDIYDKPITKIELKNVTVKNDDDTIIKDINYAIERGKLTVITGESGGGKTTSLRALTGIAERLSGDIIINDEYKVISMYSFIDRMSVVMQSPYILNRNVKQNVYYPDISFTPEAKETITNLHMNQIINKKFNEDCEEDLSQKLSGGEKKRICILRGLIQDREVYIFDEPTNELDADNTKAVLNEINKLKSKAIVMVVTHDKRMIDKADQVIHINNAVRIDTPESV